LIVGHSLSNHPNDQGEIKPTLDAIPSELGMPEAAILDNGYFSEPNIELLEAHGIEPYIATGRVPHYLSLPEIVANNMEPQHTAQTEEQKNAEIVITEEACELNIEAITTDDASFDTSDVEIAYELSSNEVEGIGSVSFQDKPSEEPSIEDEPSAKVKMASKLKTEAGKAIYRLRKCTVEPVIGIIKETIGFRQFSLRGLEATAGEWSLICMAFNLKRLHVLADGELCLL